MFDIGNTVGFCRSIALASAMVGAGCQKETQRPDFLTRSNQDCALGDLSACSMLDALRVQSAIVKPTVSSQPERTQLEHYTDAIMDSIRKARSSGPSKQLEIEPATVPRTAQPITIP
jgi:hypothetical protein